VDQEGARPLGYTLEAVIGVTAVLHAAVRQLPSAAFVPLRHDIALVPMTDELFDAVTDSSADQPVGFWKMAAGFDRQLASWSAAGPVGYVEAEFFGGVGRQGAALWVAGELRLGPLFVGEGEPFAPKEVRSRSC
jgi:hypothetical protein